MKGWLALWMALPITAALIVWGAPHWVSPPDLALATKLFLNHALLDIAPEPLEQLRYLIAIMALPLTYFLISWTLISKISLIPPFFTVLLGFTAQLFLAGFAVFNLVYQSIYLRNYFPLDLVLPLAGLSLAVFAMNRVLPQLGTFFRLRHRWPPLTIAVLLVAWKLLTCISTSKSLGWVDASTVAFHLPYTFGEFAAVGNGRTPWVDFIPQYQLLLPYLLLPVFKILGFNVGSFSAVMALLTATGFSIIYWIFFRVARSSWKALAMFVPFVGLSFYVTSHSSVGVWLNPFNYYAVGPLRYLGPWVVCAALVVYLDRPSLIRRIALLLLAAAASLNNLDFGLPAAAGVLAALILDNGKLDRGWLIQAVRSALELALSFTLVLTLFSAFTWLRSGQWPELARIGMFQRIFAVYGFAMIPMPAWGLHWLIYGTFMTALLVPTWRFINGTTHQRRLLNGLQAFSGVFGAGVLSYFVGRSHEEVLIAVFSAWALAFAFLGLDQWNRLGRFPILLSFLVGFFLAGTSQALKLPSPLGQLHRINSQIGEPYTTVSNEARFVQSLAKPGEAVGIVYPYGHWIALEAQVNNVYPFSHPGSLVLKSQIAMVMQSFHYYHVRQVFGEFSEELAAALTQQGFTRTRFQGDFEAWEQKSGH